MRMVTLDFVRILNNPKNRYGLTVTELELLNQRAAEIRVASMPVAGGEPGGAEGGGVLLDIGHKDPRRVRCWKKRCDGGRVSVRTAPDASAGEPLAASQAVHALHLRSESRLAQGVFWGGRPQA